MRALLILLLALPAAASDDVDAYLSNKPADKAVSVDTGGLHQDSAVAKSTSSANGSVRDNGLQDPTLDKGATLGEGFKPSDSSQTDAFGRKTKSDKSASGSGGTVGGQSAGGVNVPPTAADIPSGCPAPGGNVLMKRIYPGQGSINFTFDDPPAAGQAPTIYAFRLPTFGGRMAKDAEMEFVNDTVKAGRARIGFSRCPGDFSWAKSYSYKIPVPKTHVTDPNGCFVLADGESSAQYPGHSCYSGAPGKTATDQAFNPCYAERSLDSFVLSYAVGQPGASYDATSMAWIYSCPVPPQPDGHTWYMNVQFIDEAGRDTCPMHKWQCNNAFVWHGGNLDQVGWGHDNAVWAEELPEEKTDEFYDKGPVANHYRPQSHWDGFCSSGDGKPWVLEPDCTPKPGGQSPAR